MGSVSSYSRDDPLPSVSSLLKPLEAREFRNSCFSVRIMFRSDLITVMGGMAYIDAVLPPKVQNYSLLEYLFVLPKKETFLNKYSLLDLDDG